MLLSPISQCLNFEIFAHLQIMDASDGRLPYLRIRVYISLSACIKSRILEIPIILSVDLKKCHYHFNDFHKMSGRSMCYIR